MATKPALTREAIAITEKKMDMTLDDIIKQSKKSSSKVKRPRASNKSWGFLNGGVASQRNSSKVQQFMDSRLSLRQGVLAQRRSNFRGRQFPLAKEIARKAAVTPIRNRAFIRNRVVNWNKPRIVATPVPRNAAIAATPVPRNAAMGGFAGKGRMVVGKQRPQTLDSLFANMKERRMKVLSQQMNMHGPQNTAARRRGAQQQQQQRGRGRRAFGAQFGGNFAN